MPAAIVDVAFKTKLKNSWTICGVNNGLRAGDPQGLTEPPSDVDAFLEVQYPVVNGAHPVLGRYYFEEGAARLVLKVKNGIGQTTGNEWADTLAALFREVDLGNGVETFTPSLPIFDDESDDGNWVEHAVIVPYRFQFAG